MSALDGLVYVSVTAWCAVAHRDVCDLFTDSDVAVTRLVARERARRGDATLAAARRVAARAAARYAPLFLASRLRPAPRLLPAPPVERLDAGVAAARWPRLVR